MIPKQFSTSTKKRDPLKMAITIELTNRIPEAFKSSSRAALRMAVICVAVFCFSLFAGVSFFSAITFPHRYFSMLVRNELRPIGPFDVLSHAHYAYDVHRTRYHCIAYKISL